MAPLFTSSHDRRSRAEVRRVADAGLLETYRTGQGDDDATRSPLTWAERTAAVFLWGFLAALAAAELTRLFG